MIKKEIPEKVKIRVLNVTKDTVMIRKMLVYVGIIIISVSFKKTYSQVKRDYGQAVGLKLRSSLSACFINDYTTRMNFLDKAFDPKVESMVGDKKKSISDSIRNSFLEKIYFVELAVYNSSNYMADSVAIINEDADSVMVKYIHKIKGQLKMRAKGLKIAPCFIYRIYVYYDFLTQDLESVISKYHLSVSIIDLKKMEELEKSNNVILQSPITIRIPSFSKVN